MWKFVTRWKRPVKVIAVAAVAVWLLWMIVVPRIVRTQVIAALERAGFSSVTMDLPEVGLTRAQVRYVMTGKRPELSAARVWATYTPWSLLQGRVRRVEIEGLDLWLPLQRTVPAASAGPTSRPASPPTSAPAAFDEIVVRDSRLHFPGRAGGVMVPVDAVGRANTQHQVEVALTASLGETAVALSAVVSPDLSTCDWQGSVRGLSAGSVASWTGKLPPVTGEVSVDAKGKLQLGAATRIDVESLQVVWPKPSVALGNRPLVAEEARLELSGAAWQQGADWLLELGEASRLRVGGLVAFEDMAPATVWSRFGKAKLRLGADGTWEAQGEEGALGISSARVQLKPWRLALAKEGLIGGFDVVLSEVELKKNRAMERIAPALVRWNLGGKLQGKAAVHWNGGVLSSGALLGLTDGSMLNTEYELSVTGVESSVQLTQLFPPRMAPAQKLKVDYLQVGKWEMRTAAAAVSVPGDGTVHVDSASLGWAGGQVACEPFDLQLSDPVVKTTLSGHDLDLGKVLWVLTGEKAYGEGAVTLRIPVAFKWPQIRFGEGFAEAAKGSTLHLSAQADQLGRWLSASDPRFATDPAQSRIRERLVEALREFRLEQFRADFVRENQRLKTTIVLRGAGAKGEKPQAVNLNLTAMDLDWLLSRYLARRR